MTFTLFEKKLLYLLSGVLKSVPISDLESLLYIRRNTKLTEEEESMVKEDPDMDVDLDLDEVHLSVLYKCITSPEHNIRVPNSERSLNLIEKISVKDITKNKKSKK